MVPLWKNLSLGNRFTRNRTMCVLTALLTQTVLVLAAKDQQDQELKKCFGNIHKIWEDKYDESLDGEYNLVKKPTRDMIDLLEVFQTEQKKVFDKGESIPVIFLDIDGVLNTGADQGDELDEKLVRNFLKIFKKVPQARIVLSSTWRKYPENVKIINDRLAKAELPPILDVTCHPSDIYKKEQPLTDEQFAKIEDNRAGEILRYTFRHASFGFIGNYVILDDYDVAGKPSGHDLKDNFVKTDENVGLTKELVEMAIKILKRGAMGSEIFEDKNLEEAPIEDRTYRAARTKWRLKFSEGEQVEARTKRGWALATVTQVNEDGTYDLKFADKVNAQGHIDKGTIGRNWRKSNVRKPTPKTS